MSDFCFFIFIKKKRKHFHMILFMCDWIWPRRNKRIQKFFFKCFFLNSFISYSTHKKKPQRSLLSSFSQHCNWTWGNECSLKLKTNCFIRIAIGKKKHFFWKIKTFFECFFVYRCHGAFLPLYCAEVTIVVQNASLYLCVLIIVLASIDKTRTANISFIKNASQLIFFFFRKTMPRIEEHHHMRV